MSTINERERLTLEQARRWPVFFALQFFFAITGVVAVSTYLSTVPFGETPRSLNGRAFVTTLIGAVLFTLLMRWRSKRTGSGAPATQR
jgi:hypothetical protein